MTSEEQGIRYCDVTVSRYNGFKILKQTFHIVVELKTAEIRNRNTPLCSNARNCESQTMKCAKMRLKKKTVSFNSSSKIS